MDARRAALEKLIDHAALFPPASMTVEDALAEDERVRAADTGWIVGRFVVRASQLSQLGEREMPLSVVADADVPDDDRIEAVEIPLSNTVLQSPGRDVYVERPIGDLAWLEELDGARAKVRCGGDDVPSVDQLAAFIRRCRDLGVPFKATAGLHHPLRAAYRLTYEPDSATGTMFGFLNVFLTAALLRGGGSMDDARALLEDSDASAFRVDDDSIAWRGHRFDAADLADMRHLAVSFGSCSFREPMEEMQLLRVA